MNKKGFTLIELLVVIAIIGILSGTVVISMTGTTEASKNSRIKSSMGQLRTVTETYKYTTGAGNYASAMFTSSPGYELITDISNNGGSFLDASPYVNTSSWCLAVKMNLDSYWCIDYTGYSVENKKCSTAPFRCSVDI